MARKASATFVFMLVIAVLVCRGEPYAVYYSSSGPIDDSVDYPTNEPPGAGNDTHDFTATDAERYKSDKLHERLMQTMNDNRVALIGLFGTEAEAKNYVFRHQSKLITKYWSLDEVYATINNRRHIYSESDHDSYVLPGVDKVLRVLEEEIVDLPKHEYKNQQNLFDVLNSSKSVIDCSLTRTQRNQYFQDIKDSVPIDVWECTSAIPSLWWKLVNANYEGKNCDLNEALKSVIDIIQEFKGKDKKTPVTEIKLDYVLTMSKPEHVEFLEPFLCKQTEPEKCQIYQDMLCKSLDYNQVVTATDQINAGSSKIIQTNPKNMFILLNVQQDLGEVANKLTTIASVRSSVDTEKPQQMLDAYLGIIDTAIGNKNIEAWKKTQDSDALNQFKKVLLNTEEFIGNAAEMVLRSGTKNVTVEKDALSLSMQEAAKNSTVEFSFPNAQIWTDIRTGSEGGSNFKVYALFYNTWHEILTQILGTEKLELNLNDNIANSPGHNNLTNLIGRGGIISLSTQTDREKKSVPVTFKMYFDEEKNLYNTAGFNNITHCFSCGFLDVTSKMWKTDGCIAKEVDDVSVTCYCNHTTNFAAFMTPFEVNFEATESEKLWLNILEYIGSIASVIGLILSSVSFYIVRNTVRNDRLRAHINLSLAFLFVHLIQLGADFAVENNTACELVTVASHYFLLSAFMWMFVEGVFLYFYVVQVFMLSRIKNKRWMYVIGWGIPIVIVTISAGYGLPNDIYVQAVKHSTSPCEEGQVQFPPQQEIEYAYCWLSTSSHMIWSFVAPAMCVIVFNIVILLKVILVLVKLSGRSNGMRNYQVSNPANPNYGYQAKTRPSVQGHTTKSDSHEMTGNEQAEKSVFNNETLHGNVVTHVGGSIPSSRSNSHSHQYALVRPRPSVNPSPSDNNFLSDVKTAVKGAAVLLPLLGISWVIGMFSHAGYGLSIMFVLLNSTQGVAIFFVYVVFNGEVWRALQRRLELHKLDKYNKNRGRTSSTSSLKSAFNKGLLRNWKRRSTAISTLSSTTQTV